MEYNCKELMAIFSINFSEPVLIKEQINMVDLLRIDVATALKYSILPKNFLNPGKLVSELVQFREPRICLIKIQSKHLAICFKNSPKKEQDLLRFGSQQNLTSKPITMVSLPKIKSTMFVALFDPISKEYS